MSYKSKFFLVIGIVFGAFMIAIPVTMTISAFTSTSLTLLDNAGVMIESKGVRIYVDPINLPSKYGRKPADVILITHPHGDHYEPLSLNLIQKETTINVFPENMTAEIALYNGVGVNPGDNFGVEHINITAFYMYTFPVDIYPASHPQEANWTSYIIDVDGFVLFHAGDSKNIPEYEQLNGLIDVALLPLGPGCQTMTDLEVVEVINTIEPRYVVPIHYAQYSNDNFYATYGVLFDASYINLEYFSSHRF